MEQFFETGLQMVTRSTPSRLYFNIQHTVFASMIIAVVIGAGLAEVTAVGHVRLGRVVVRAAGRLICLVRVKELPTVGMASNVVLRLLLMGMDSSAHHSRTVGMRHAT